MEDLMREAGVELLPMRKKNSHRPVPAYMTYLQASIRKIVETTGSLIERLLPKSIHAATARGFELKVAFSSLPAPSTSFHSNLGFLLQSGILNLGQTIGPEELLTDGGSKQFYEFGAIYFHRRVDDAFELHGLILQTYIDIGDI